MTGPERGRRDFRLGLGRERDVNRDLDEEFRFHLEMRVRELVEQGLAPAMARAEAERQFGDLEDARRYCKEEDLGRNRRERWQRVVRDLPGMVRQASRALRRSPIITAAAVFCLALGVGATTAVFSAVHTALLRPLPFPDPERLVTVYRTTPHFDTGPFSPNVYQAFAEGSNQLEAYSAVATGTSLLSGAEQSDRVVTARVTGNFFTMLGARPHRGRLFTAMDDADGQPLVAVVSHDFWQGHYGGDTTLVGSTVRLGGQEYTVTAILPPQFRVPHGGGMVTADFFLPMRFTASDRTNGNFLLTMGRLRAGASMEAADAELKGIMNGYIETTAPGLRGEQVRIVRLHEQSIATIRDQLLLLFGAVGLVLLIACANVAALLLARGLERHREIAVRAALGASRRAVVSQVLLETALLGGIGLLLGIGLAWVGVATIGVTAAARMPQLTGLTIDPRVLAFALALGAVVTLLCGLAPAWRAAGVDPQGALRDGGTRTGGGRRHHRFLRALVAAEVALSLVLMLGAGLVLRGFADLLGRESGFDTERLLTMVVSLDPLRYQDRHSYDAFLLPALDAIRAVPGVEEAGTNNLIPYDNWGWNFNIRYEGRPADDPTRLPIMELRQVSPSYLATMGIPLVRGELFREADRDSMGRALPYALINQAGVARDFPDEDPIGKRFQWGDNAFVTIIGVVGDIKNSGPVAVPRPEVLFHVTTTSRPTAYPLFVRTAGDPSGVIQGVVTAIRAVDGTVAVSQIRPMTQVIAESVGRPRFFATLLIVFAAVAVLLASAGLYGIMSYAVVQRTREIGIRTALGSSRSQTIGLVVRQGMALVVLGLLAGLVGGAAFVRLLTSLLYGVSPFDPLTWTVGVGVLALVGIVATLVPAARAARVDPLIAIRVE